MKDSGIDWIGEIPKSWKVNKIDSLYYLRSTKVNDVDYPPLSVTMKGIVPQLATAAKTDDHDNRKLVKKGDFAINSRSDRRGSCGISDYDGSVSLINIVLTPRGQMNPRYYNWLFHTEQFADEFYKWGHGIVNDLWTTRWQDMKHIFIVSPSLDEQKKIADYLDDRCSKIDELITGTIASIEDYKKLKQAIITEAVTKGLNKDVPMKDSGVEWIGEIPKNWKISRIKYVADFNPTLLTKYDETRPVGYVPMTSVKNGYILPLEIMSSQINTGLTSFQENDLIMAKVTPCFENGNIAIAEGLAQSVGFGSSELFIFRIHSINRKFLLYYLQNSIFRDKCISTMTGVAGLKRVSGYFVKNAYVTYPPLDEQKEIANYLDKKIGNIDDIINEKTGLIEDLKAYKKSLIYEVVTGKKEVK